MALCGNRGQSCRLRFRGMDSLKLKTCELWWNGPKFLMSNQYPQRQIPVAVIKDPGNRDYTGMWVRLGSTDLMAGKVMFLRSNQGDRLDGNESVADSFRSDLVGFKSWPGRFLGAFSSLLRLPEKTSSREANSLPGDTPFVTPILNR
ncbi:hypothetical protein TNCV_4643701 [Trichonephila clavipes]|nr:hypothetical protein TNCV_4643701 [Trichonephila clavipes]